MERTDDEHAASLELGLRGLELAYDRLKELEGPGADDLVAVGVAVAECCFWVCAVAEELGRKGEEGRLDAFRWARNRAAHDLLVRVETGDGFVLGSGRLNRDRLAHSRWVIRSELGNVSKPDREGEASYDEWLAGQPVMVTVRAARRMLDTEFDARCAQGKA